MGEIVLRVAMAAAMLWLARALYSDDDTPGEHSQAIGPEG